MNIYGKLTKGSEYLIGTDQADVFYPLGGSDLIDGKQGFDQVVVNWPSTGFAITAVDGITYLDAVSGASSADRVTLRDVESVQFSDRTVSLEMPDTFQNTAGSDNFNGGPGRDTTVYAGARSLYSVDVRLAGLSVARFDQSEGRDWLQNMERLSFSDVSVAYDSSGAAGITLRVLGAVFGAGAVGNRALAGIGLDLVDKQGHEEASLMNLALRAQLGAQFDRPESVVDLLYTNVVGTAPTPAQAQPFVDMLRSGVHSPVTLAMMAAGTELNLQRVGLVGVPFNGLEYTVPA